LSLRKWGQIIWFRTTNFLKTAPQLPICATTFWDMRLLLCGKSISPVSSKVLVRATTCHLYGCLIVLLHYELTNLLCRVLLWLQVTVTHQLPETCTLPYENGLTVQFGQTITTTDSTLSFNCQTWRIYILSAAFGPQ
jgi:hypothetical protein